MTVEDLLEEFIEVQCQRLTNLYSRQDITDTADEDANAWSDLQGALKRGTLDYRCQQAAKVYVVARDQGIDAAVLWKLQHD